MRRLPVVLAAGIILFAGAPTGDPLPDPHGDPDHGVLREATLPSTRGECNQCHPSHGDDVLGVEPLLLFTDNTNALAFWSQGAAACHGDRPVNYPLDESDRLPEGDPDAGYFEANTGGTRQVGVEFRGRWPGEAVYTDARIVGDGRFASPHAYDSDMPRQGPDGEGLCFNCHDPHPTQNPLDLLVKPYRGIGGASGTGAPLEYELCFSCHGLGGPPGMEPENLRIRDWYDPVLNPETAGHRIRRDPDIALSWPASVRVGDMLACSDCHNAHGSRGNDGVSPNAFLISDQRPGWSGLTDTLNDAEQSRRFCFGCHIASDGIPGIRSVRGIVLNTLPASVPEHDSFAAQSCHDCHGRDYASPTGFNVHHPDASPGGAAFGGARDFFGD